MLTFTFGQGPHSARTRSGHEESVIPSQHLTIGEFSRASGLTPRALRLYAERGILEPVHVDEESGHRWYSTAQIRSGQTLWALREAQVPLSELTDVDAFDIDAFRERLLARRALEDTALRMAAAYRSIRVEDWPVRAAAVPAQPWVGTGIVIAVDDDGGPPETFLQLPAAFARHQAALSNAVSATGSTVDDSWWTTPGDTDAGATEVTMHVCLPIRRDLDDAGWEALVTHVRRLLGDPAVDVVRGVLPARIEVLCDVDVDHGDEAMSMASGLAPRLAIDAYIDRHRLRPLSPHTREVNHGPLLVAPTVTVRDALQA